MLSGFVAFFTWPDRLFDADAYLHLSLARELGERGLPDGLSWARFSTLAEDYGDKELLFHVLLVPLVTAVDPELGGKLALALLCTALAGSLWRLGSIALGGRGWIVPVLVFGSGSFLLRALRLRPELLALLLLLWVVWALAERRYRLAALLACAFALSHTAFHSLLGLAVLFFLWQRWAERRWEWRLLAAVALGVVSGVIVHPQLPDNLAVFWVQNVDFFQLRSQLAVGEEFRPHTSFDLLQLDLVFALGLATLALARRPEGPSGGDAARRAASFCWIATAAFGALFLQMGRFATLTIPFAALGLAFELRARGFVVGDRLALPGGRSLSTAAALGALAILGLANAVIVGFVNWQLAGSFDARLRHELDALAGQLPGGARVAASWNDAELYAFHAPHARYLNVYDPVFMAVADPIRHALWTQVLAGALPDVPSAIAGALDSEFVAFQAAGREALLDRLAHDPRAVPVHRGAHVAFRLRAAPPGSFVSDWAFLPSSLPTDGGAYVDARAGLGPDGCARLQRFEPIQDGRTRWFELAAWGPTAVFVDGQQRLQLTEAELAQLGGGVLIPLRGEPGTRQRWDVRTCAHEGQAGFYWVRRR